MYLRETTMEKERELTEEEKLEKKHLEEIYKNLEKNEDEEDEF